MSNINKNTKPKAPATNKPKPIQKPKTAIHPKTNKIKQKLPKPVKKEDKKEEKEKQDLIISNDTVQINSKINEIFAT
jgi:hypothetical protein